MAATTSAATGVGTATAAARAPRSETLARLEGAVKQIADLRALLAEQLDTRVLAAHPTVRAPAQPAPKDAGRQKSKNNRTSDAGAASFGRRHTPCRSTPL